MSQASVGRGVLVVTLFHTSLCGTTQDRYKSCFVLSLGAAFDVVVLGREIDKLQPLALAAGWSLECLCSAFAAVAKVASETNSHKLAC